MKPIKTLNAIKLGSRLVLCSSITLCQSSTWKLVLLMYCTFFISFSFSFQLFFVPYYILSIYSFHYTFYKVNIDGTINSRSKCTRKIYLLFQVCLIISYSRRILERIWNFYELEIFYENFRMNFLFKFWLYRASVKPKASTKSIGFKNIFTHSSKYV